MDTSEQGYHGYGTTPTELGLGGAAVMYVGQVRVAGCALARYGVHRYCDSCQLCSNNFVRTVPGCLWLTRGQRAGRTECGVSELTWSSHVRPSALRTRSPALQCLLQHVQLRQLPT